MTEATRLSKRLIALIGCSRREAELYIEGGWVTVDGEVVDAPQHPVHDERVELLPGAKAEPLEPVTLLLHQTPLQNPDEAFAQIRPDSRWTEQADAPRQLRGHFARQQQVLPLQAGASGLAVFTQDWRTLRKLNSDASRLEQEYLVEVIGQMAEGGLARLADGGDYKRRWLPPVKASWQSEQRLRLVVKNPAPGLLVSLCESVGLKITAMRRIRIGGLAMGKLPAGQWRYALPNERF